MESREEGTGQEAVGAGGEGKGRERETGRTMAISETRRERCWSK